MADIGVAMSGGGHRAAAFGLGALLYLAEAEANHDVCSVSSVSGGSLTNGYVAQEIDYKGASAAAFRAVAAKLAQRIATKGTLWASWATRLYVAILFVLALADVIGVWFLPFAGWIRLLIFLGGLAVLGMYAWLRGWVASYAFATTLFSGSGGRTRLADVHHSLDHIICATDLHAGENVYFSGRFVCSYRFGWGGPAGLPLHVAVQASSALPGGFPPRWVRTVPHGFLDPGDPQAATTTRMCLVDGGVYDNMADQWMLDVPKRNARWGTHDPHLAEPAEVVVVNASAGLEWGKVGKLRFPLLGEILSLLRDKDVLYDNGTSVRRELLYERFARASTGDNHLRGVLVHIPRSPFVVPDAYANGNDPAASRARAALAELGDTRATWAQVAAADATVGTNLSALGVDTTARLLRHAFVSTMVNAHVVLGYPLLAVPPQDWFASIAEGVPRERPA